MANTIAHSIDMILLRLIQVWLTFPANIGTIRQKVNPAVVALAYMTTGFSDEESANAVFELQEQVIPAQMDLPGAAVTSNTLDRNSSMLIVK